MATDEEIIPGLRVYIHEDAIADNTIRFLDDLGVELRIPTLPDDEGWYILDQEFVKAIAKLYSKVAVVRTIGGGYYHVEDDPEREQFVYSDSVHMDRKRALAKARHHAIELAQEAREREEKEEIGSSKQ